MFHSAYPEQLSGWAEDQLLLLHVGPYTVIYTFQLIHPPVTPKADNSMISILQMRKLGTP